MEFDNPLTWTWPPERTPDQDAAWEVACLKNLAIAIQEHADQIDVYLDVEDSDCIHINIFKSHRKTGEAYVNRSAEANDHPMFSVYSGFEEQELHSASLDECARHLIASNGFPVSR